MADTHPKSCGNPPKPRVDRRAAQDRLRGFFDDLVDDGGPAGINAFCTHVGITMPIDGDNLTQRWWATFLATYLAGDGKVDEHKVASDFASFPPIVARVAEIRRERARH